MSNQHYDGIIDFTIDDKKYTADVKARASYSFRRGRMYLRNGDPGYPDEEDFEIDDVEVLSITDENGDEITYDEDTMYDPICDALNGVDWIQDECEPPEPDYDPPEYDEAYTKACLEEDL